MGRMSREFSLVLLGAGILTAGYFLWPQEDLEAKANEQAAQQVAGSRTGYYRHMPFLFIHTGYYGGGGRVSSPARAGVSRGGFGGTGSAFSGGS